ncbi:hypothetical protein IB75_03020 [Nitrosococcus oceani C-27]|nr:hypothetical protein IB75_03020 [Nitrosococcus oceani C-27]
MEWEQIGTEKSRKIGFFPKENLSSAGINDRPGSRSIRVKGIGIVKRSLMSCMLAGELEDNASNWNSLFVHVEWLVKKEFKVEIEPDHGRLTNIRAATVYEEYLPQLQECIITRLIDV